MFMFFIEILQRQRVFFGNIYFLRILCITLPPACLAQALPEKTSAIQQAGLKLNLSVKNPRKQVFVNQMKQVLPWAALVKRIASHYPQGKTERPPFSLQTMLRVHFMQQWLRLTYPGMEVAFFDTPLYRKFAQPEEFGRLPDESTLLRFGKNPSPHHRLAQHRLAEYILGVVDATIDKNVAHPL
jgi:IS5 family transposase